MRPSIAQACPRCLRLNACRQLAGTGVTGVIPQGWCLGPLKASLRHM